MLKKKVTASVVVMSILLTAILGGCQKAEPKKNSETAATPTAQQELKPVNLKYYYYGSAKSGDQAVYDAINKILNDKLKVNMEFVKVNSADYTQKMTIMINAQEEFDLCFTSPDSLNYFDNATKGSFTDLTELLPKYAPKTYALYKPDIWNAAKVNNKIYASINQQIFARQAGLQVSKQLADKYSFNYKDVKKLSDLTPFLEKVKVGEPVDTTDQLFNPSMKLHVFSYFYPSYQWETIGGTDVPGVSKTNEKSPKVFNEYATPEFKDFVLTLADFQTKGLIAKDALTRPTFDMTKYAAAYISTIMPGIESTLKASYKNDRYVISLGDPLLTTYGAIATMTAVSATSKNPERAVMYIELMNTNKEAYNTLTWGIQDVDYAKKGENRVEALPGAKYSDQGWKFGDQFNSFVSGVQEDDVWIKTKELNDKAIISNIYGFNFDPANLKTEIANCTAIVNEYKAIFNTGMYGSATQSKLDEFLGKLKTAGVDKVVAEKQKQLDAFMAKKK